ncbi:FAD-binding oxidoreductase [Streptomyces sp. SCA3-4]|uniref:FAD-binding oxidoreductase n=1 Tax=Streptomyces sichuanensis TaxID=2871810 RepID=UPI001CE3058E|nr:FAD-binding oxidoreductase [Streptomyces sichuanensis]MCA6094842.1 FAD-binding oxidoreductase [Streptomyces sichuanensis]
MSRTPVPRSARWLAEHRWLYVVPVLLPLSKAYALAEALSSSRLLRPRRGALRRHRRRVARMQARVRQRERQGGEGLICTARPQWRSMAHSREESYKDGAFLVPAHLDDILHVDTGRGTVTVGPAVTMGRLTSALPRGWTLPVVPEMEDLTVGGLIMGYGIETSSHRHGLFADTVASCEVLLAGGEVVVADRTRRADLFHALPWSRGTLGLLTSVRLRMVPSAPWVRLTYHRLDSAAALTECIASYSSGPHPPDFVEGFHFSPTESVVVTGTLADRPRAGDGTVNRMGRWYKPWFYEHARARCRLPRNAEYVPLRDFYFRHSRSIYWAAEMLVPSGNHPLFRYTLGWLMPPKAAFLKRTETPGIRRMYLQNTATQEALVPVRALPEAIEKCREAFHVDRMWLCPVTLRRTEPEGLVSPGTPDGLYVDIAVVFETPEPVRLGRPWDARQATREFETWLLDNGGFQVPYVASHMTHEEFWTMFDGRPYLAAREKYGAEGSFLDIYDKVSRN